MIIITLAGDSSRFFQSGYKTVKYKLPLGNSTVLEEIIKYKKSNVYIDGLILNFTRNISMISVPHYPRLEGKSNYNFSKLFGLWCNMAENFPIKPFRLATLVGFFLKMIIILFK